MAKIYMIRHGQAAEGWGENKDPDLSELGWQQAAAVAEEVAALLPKPVPIYSSPLQRCQSTAQPLSQLWGQDIVIEPRVSEVPSPIDDLQARAVWLRRVMSGTWDAFYADPETKPTALYKQWQADVEAALHEHSRAGDIVIFSHFIALNVAFTAATGADACVGFRPDNASLTIFESDGTRLSLLQQGREAETKVN